MRVTFAWINVLVRFWWEAAIVKEELRVFRCVDRGHLLLPVSGDDELRGARLKVQGLGFRV